MLFPINRVSEKANVINVVKLANRLKNMEYAIRDVAAIAEKVAQRKRVHYLNIGDPGLFDAFQTPKYICDSLCKATVDGKNNYANSLGVLELRKAIVEYERKKNKIDLPMDNILITSGVSEAIFFATAGLIERGTEMLLPGPCYSTYRSYVEFFEGKGVDYRLVEEEGWNPDVDDLRKKINENTAAILISSPNNPTGRMWKPKTMKEIFDIAGEHNLIVISDEIYDRIVFDNEYACPGSIAKEIPIIGMNGFSKAHMATGWRLGYMYFLDPDGQMEELKLNIEKLARTRLCANTPAQYAAIESYKKPQDHTAKMVSILRKQRDYSMKRIQELDLITCVEPDGAFYMFPKINLNGIWKDDREFVLDLLQETGVCFVYGSGFGEYGKGHFRSTFLPPIEELGEVFDKINVYIKKKMNHKP